MKIKKKISSLIICSTLILGSFNLSFADSSKVVTLGTNLSTEQKQKMLEYFGVNKNEAVVLDVNNQQERKYLQGVASEAQLGKKTFSCSYVEPTKKGSGINVKTANLTWVTSSMIATTLSTAGLEDANVVVASLFPVSGTGGLTGVMMAFEDATGKKLDENKKEIASKELITTGDLGDKIGQDKATGVINDIKTEVIKNNTSDKTQIAQTINNITNNYNVTLTEEQKQKITDLMKKISDQDYDYSKIKETLKNVSDNVDKNLESVGEAVNKSGFFEKIGEWFKNLFSSSNKDLGILESTNDKILGKDATIDATDDKAITLPSGEEVEGFFTKIYNWFTGLFGDKPESPNTDSNKTINESEESINNSDDNKVNDNNKESKDTKKDIIDPNSEKNDHFSSK